MTEPLTVEILVDPACPWAWLTHRWLDEVSRVRSVRVVTRLFDLAEINRGEQEESRRTSHAAGETALRALVQARREGGDESMARYYSELGEAWHERGEPLSLTETLDRAAAAAGLEPGLAGRALADATTADELLAEHRAAVEEGAFGVPTLRIPGAAAWFGPVLDRRVAGEEAGHLWDALLPLLRNSMLFELKRNRTTRADVGRYRETVAAAAG